MGKENKEEVYGKAEVTSTGSKRYNTGKPQMHHIPPKFFIELADLLTISASKYGRWNFANGQPYTMPYDSMMRHIASFMDGEDLDQESCKSHLLHIAANAMIMWTTQEYRVEDNPELDDRFSTYLQKD